MRSSLFLILVPALTAAPLVAQSGATLDLRVSESAGRPLGDVRVDVLAPHRVGSVTDSHGHVVMRRVPAGTQLLRVQRIGYETQSLALDLEPGDTVRLDLTLAASSIPLDTVTATRARLVPALERNGFYDRRKVGGGHVLTRPDLDQHIGEPTHFAFYRIPSVSVVMKRNTPVLFNTRAPGCRMRVFVDAMPWRDADVDELPQEVIEAIEVYASPSEIPVEFGGAESGCGVVLIWTRH